MWFVWFLLFRQGMEPRVWQWDCWVPSLDLQGIPILILKICLLSVSPHLIVSSQRQCLKRTVPGFWQEESKLSALLSAECNITNQIVTLNEYNINDSCLPWVSSSSWWGDAGGTQTNLLASCLTTFQTTVPMSARVIPLKYKSDYNPLLKEGQWLPIVPMCWVLSCFSRVQSHGL